MDTIKPGWQTTEFWATIFAQLVGLALTTGFINPAQATAATAQAGTVGGIVLLLVSGVAYTLSRTLVKHHAATLAAESEATASQTSGPSPWPYVPRLDGSEKPVQDAPNRLPDSPPAPSYAPITAPRPAIVAPTTVTIASSI